MKKIFVLICTFTAIRSFAQSDTIYTYLNKAYEKAAKDTATYVEKLYRSGKNYVWQQYHLNKGELEQEAVYADKEKRKPAGDYKTYKEGKLFHVETFDAKGSLASGVYFFPDGRKRSEIIWNGNKTVKETGWDEKGNEIPGYIVMREAQFTGGVKGWIAYIKKNLDVELPARIGMPAGTYESIVEFLVDKEGNISEVSGKTKHKCAPCVLEAVRIVENGPKWIPAVINNEKVVYRQKQSISFVVEEEEED